MKLLEKTQERSIWKWTSEEAPSCVTTFNVKTAAELLREHFSALRTNFFVVKKTNASWRRFPGLFSSSEEKLRRLAVLFSDWKIPGYIANSDSSTIYPRGNLDASTIVCGIAPGWTETPYYEAAWLLGPSSRLLADACQSQNVYFTNVSKDAFLNNKYSAEVAREWKSSFENEVSLIQPRRIIFLGSYDIYNELTLPSEVKLHRAQHPSYVLRQPRAYQQNWVSQLQRIQQAFAKELKKPEEASDISSNFDIGWMTQICLEVSETLC